MEKDLEQLFRVVSAVSPLSDEDWEHFSKIWQPFKARRKELLTHAGERENFLYFVTEGVQRVYYLDDEGREATLVFTYAPSFGGVLDALMLNSTSRYYYEALTPSKFLRTTAETLRVAMLHPGIEQMVLKGLSGALSGVMERLVELQCFSSEEKFKSLLKRSPHVLTLIPHKYLANYIGIDATNFSKLINSIRL